MKATKKKQSYQIPPREVVQTVGVVLLVIDVILIVIILINFQAIGWQAVLLLVGIVSSLFFPIKAIQTGKPEWILLDLLLPS